MVSMWAYLLFFIIIVQVFFNKECELILIPKLLFNWTVVISTIVGLAVTIRDKILLKGEDKL